jgi:hypothetical protein
MNEYLLQASHSDFKNRKHCKSFLGIHHQEDTSSLDLLVQEVG